MLNLRAPQQTGEAIMTRRSRDAGCGRRRGEASASSLAGDGVADRQELLRRSGRVPHRHDPGTVAAELEELLAVLAHDIRSPLNTLGMSCELLANRIDPHDAVAARQMEVVHYTIRQIDRLVGDVLAMASLRTRTLRRSMPACAVRPVVAEAVADHRALADASGVRLSVDLPDAECHARIDRASLLRVFANLLTNAIRFTPANGSVAVHAERVGEEIDFVVCDTGSGIPEEELTHVFERAPLQHDERSGSGGFGLSIVKGIVESCGGRVSAESEVGRGSSFTFVLPVAAPVRASEGVDDAHVVSTAAAAAV